MPRDPEYGMDVDKDKAIRKKIETSRTTAVSHALTCMSDLSKKTITKINSNLFRAFIYNTMMIPIAAIGPLNPVYAAGAMAISSLTVVTNSATLRLKTSLQRIQHLNFYNQRKNVERR